jgi:hypothetical protein
MKRAAPWLLYAALLAVVAALALAARGDSGANSPVRSIDNPGGSGLRALFLYLSESGFDVRAQRAALDALPADVGTVVLAAPTERPVEPGEIEALDRFVRRGGKLVYLAPRPLTSGPTRLQRWLEIREGVAVDAVDVGPNDPLGTTATVWRPAGPFSGASTLRLRHERGLEVDAEDAVPIAGVAGIPEVWWRKLGRGDVWLWAGPDAAENRRIELNDNLIFWAHLAAQGPIAFDERHHQPEPLPPASRSLWLIAAQLVGCTLAFAFARGSRLGPPRAEVADPHRSTLEYLHSLAWLIRRARVERELAPELMHRLRITLHERTGIPTSWSDEDVARELGERSNVSGDDYRRFASELQAALAQPAVRARDYARLSRRAARIERRLLGLAD